MICPMCCTEDNSVTPTLSACSVCGSAMVRGAKTAEKMKKFSKPKEPPICENAEIKLAGGDTCTPIKSKENNNGNSKNDPCFTTSEVPTSAHRNKFSGGLNERTSRTTNLRGNRSSGIDVKVSYKNVNFAVSESELEFAGEPNNKPEIEIVKIGDVDDVCNQDLKSKIAPRPTLCPETTCSRVVAIDSITSHFRFDHSKIPALTLAHSKNKSVIFNMDSIEHGKSRCIALFLLPSAESRCNITSSLERDITRSTSSSKRQQGLASLSLMCTRVSFLLPQLDKRCHIEKEIGNNLKNTPSRKSRVGKYVLSDLNEIKTCMKREEFLLIWLCGVDTSLICSLTVRGAETTRSHGYTGRVHDVRDTQDGHTLLCSADCLAIQGAAVNTMLGETGGRLIADVLLCSSV